MGSLQSVQRVFNKNQFVPGSVVLVQGASSGLGREIALRYAKRQCPMVVSGRQEAKLQELVAECQKEHGNKNVHYIVAEATNEQDCKALADFTLAKFGRIDIVVLAAGIGAHSFFRDVKNVDVVRKVMEVNYMG